MITLIYKNFPNSIKADLSKELSYSQICDFVRLKKNFDKYFYEKGKDGNKRLKKLIFSKKDDIDSKIFNGLLAFLNPNIDVMNDCNNQLLKLLPNTQSLQESVARLRYNHSEDFICEHCGKPFKPSFHTLKRKDLEELPKFCSKKCSNNDEKVKAKNAQSVSRALTKVYEERGEEVLEKRKNTNYERYGVNSPSLFVSDEFQEKAKETIKEKYGVDNYFKLEEPHIKAKEAINKLRVEMVKNKYGFDIKVLKNNSILIKNGCDKCGDIIVTKDQFYNRLRKFQKDRPMCPICSPDRDLTSSIEYIVLNILDELKSEHNVDFEVLQHFKLENIEADIFIPSKNLIIECNGVYWHSSVYKDKQYHKNKREIFEKRGYQMLSFWEDDLKNESKRDIIKGILQSKLGLNKRVFARNCVLKALIVKKDKRLLKSFLEENHLQGSIPSQFAFGLFLNDELIEIITFGSNRVLFGDHKNVKEKGIKIFELYRLCSKKGLTIVGGAERLLKAFIKYISNIEKDFTIVSYCHCDISNGNVYEKLGFKEVREDIGMYYVNLNQTQNNIYQRENRFNYTKQNLIKNGLINEEDFDIAKECNLELNEILMINGIFRVFDSGVKRFEFKKD